MRREEVKLGMKVVPHAKTAGSIYSSYLSSNVLRKAREKNQGYLYVTAIRSGYYTLDSKPSMDTGDHFHLSDFTPYIEPLPKLNRGTSLPLQPGDQLNISGKILEVSPTEALGNDACAECFFLNSKTNYCERPGKESLPCRKLLGMTRNLKLIKDTRIKE